MRHVDQVRMNDRSMLGEVELVLSAADLLEVDQLEVQVMIGFEVTLIDMERVDGEVETSDLELSKLSAVCNS